MSPPRPSGRLPHRPGLDGLRGVAVAAVLVYHANPSWLPGGMLGITVFFTLSGFLITSLLLAEVHATGRVDLRAFWMRRARRLVPASLVAVLLVALLARAGGGLSAPGLLGDAVAAMTWSANWRFIAEGVTYGDLFQDPSPFQHFWSLAVEEQLYLVLPLLVVGLAARRSRRRWPLAVVIVSGIAASTWAAGVLHTAGDAPGRAYYGTDARIAEPLVGALLAVIAARGSGFRMLSPGWRRLSGALGIASLAGIAVLASTLTASHHRLYDGGLLVTAALSAVVVLAATQRTPLARALSVAPLAALGRISYGVYLFHWPVYLWLEDELRGARPIELAGAQVAASISLAALSYTAIELPIRRGTRRPSIFVTGWLNGAVTVIAVLALTVSSPAAVASGAGLGPEADDPVPAVPLSPAAMAATPVHEATEHAPGTPPVVADTARAAPAAPADVAGDPIVGDNAQPDTGTAPAPRPQGNEVRVAVIGDSLGYNVGTGLSLWAETRSDAVVYNLAISACPISRGGERRFDEYETFPVNPRCAWWEDPTTERSQNLADFDPDVVVVEASLNELLDRRLPEWERWRRPGDPAYHDWLLAEYRAMFDAVRSMALGGTEILVLNAVCGDFERHERWSKVDGVDARIAALNQSVFPLMVEADRADLFEQLCPNGRYSDDLWGIEDARYDGIHLTDEAAQELARRWLGPLVLESSGRSGTATTVVPPDPTG